MIPKPSRRPPAANEIPRGKHIEVQMCAFPPTNFWPGAKSHIRGSMLFEYGMVDSALVYASLGTLLLDTSHS